MRTGTTQAGHVLGIFAAASALALGGGCSDDVVCPESVPGDVPFIAASLVETAADGASETAVELYCAADPLPGILVAFVNERELTDVGPAPDQIGLLATLEESVLVWTTGTRCSLKVTTEYGFATSGATLPEPFQVTAPLFLCVGDALTLTWSRSTSADYYVVSAKLEGTRTESALSATTTDTCASFGPSEIAGPGIVTGVVRAVSGPFPESGASGNVSGAGWGFFTAAYGDTRSAFEVTVLDTAAPHTPLRPRPRAGHSSDMRIRLER